MHKRTFSFIGAGILLALRAPAQSPAPPQTYSFTAATNMMGPMTVTANRNGSMELIDLATGSGSLHLRILYDFQAHRIYTLDLSSNLCTTQEYTSSYVPLIYDPIGGAEEMSRQTGSLKTVKREAVNGVDARVVEGDLPNGQGRVRLWLEDKFGFPVKQGLTIGKDPEKLIFEMHRLSYAPSAPALFTVPANCTRVAGSTNANGGHAEMNVDVSAQGQAGGSAAPAAKKAAAGNPNQLLGKWDFNGKDGAGVQWRGTLTVEKLDQYSTGQGNYSNACDLNVSSANAGRGVSGPCLYDGRTKTFSFEGGGSSSKFAFTAVLSPDGKSLAQGRWVEGGATGAWSASAGRR